VGKEPGKGIKKLKEFAVTMGKFVGYKGREELRKKEIHLQKRSKKKSREKEEK